MAQPIRRESPPKGSWLLGNLPELQKDWLGTLRRWKELYGDFVTVRLGPRPVVFIFDPADAEAVLVHNYKHFRKNFIIRRTRFVIGDGLLLSEGDFWLRQRRLMQPAFHRQQIALYAATMSELTNQALNSWQDGATVDMHREMTLLTRSIVSRCLFGTDVEDHAGAIEKAVDRLMNNFSALTNSATLIPLLLPTRKNLQFRRYKQQLDDLVYRFIEQRRKNAPNSNDLLSVLLRARDDAGSGMTDKQLRDEVLTLFLAGHETTASALTWAIYFLTQHPEAAHKMAEEVDAVLNDRAPTADDVPRLKYTESVFKEAMRLYPPSWLIGRETVTPCEIRGRKIPKGWNLFICPWVIHRDARWFPEPDTFRPERWLEPHIESLPRGAYLPFGAGPRQCIGNHFAMTEAVIILASIAQRFELQRNVDEPVIPVPLVSIRPQGGLPVTVRRR